MIVTAGEDGRINVLNVAHRKPVRTIGNTIYTGTQKTCPDNR